MEPRCLSSGDYGVLLLEGITHFSPSVYVLERKGGAEEEGEE